MRSRIYQVDAFTDRRFSGNPAAVCPLEAWPADEVLQAIAAENNLSETAFLVPHGEDYELRWFTPRAEVDLCGHATLAAGHVVLRILQGTRKSVRFHTASGPLTVERDGERLAMEFPAVPPEPAASPPGLARALGAGPRSVLAAKDWLAVFDEPAEVKGLEPDMRAIEALDRRGVIVTAAVRDGDETPGGEGVASRGGDEVASRARQMGSPRGGEAGPDRGGGHPDFVSRFFAPKVGVPEDPVTGSAHCTLAPYWADRLGRRSLLGRQVSERGGEVGCEVRDGRVRLSGGTVLYLEGRITF